jgi:hypothetical protein
MAIGRVLVSFISLSLRGVDEQHNFFISVLQIIFIKLLSFGVLPWKSRASTKSDNTSTMEV